MLTSINIKNFTLINELELDFHSRMTVITGETGAGKSIILDSLELVLGSRADHSIVRHDSDRADISASFDLKNCSNATSWLRENDFANANSGDSDEECIIRRIIHKDGRSKVFINGCSCPAQSVRELGSLLINIHGQHEHQALLKTDKQLELLDIFAGNANLCETVKNIYNSWSKTKKELTQLQALAENQQAKLDFVNYQLQELDNLALKSGELEQLTAEHALLSHAEELTSHINEALNLATNNEDSSILRGLNHAKNHLEKNKVIDTKIKNIIELFNNAIIQVEEATSEMQHYLNAIDSNQEHLAALEQRLNNIYSIARKHKVKPEELTVIQQNLQVELKQLLDLEVNLQNMQKKLAELEMQYNENASKLSANRKQAAKKLSNLIIEKMQLLGMEGGKFAVHFVDNTTINTNGLETAEFWVSANPGLPLQPLAKVVSGGELSRIGLAIQVITAKKNTTPILIFDEVDVGIGGKTAEIIGKMLRELAENNQIICVTHLPQVAVHGQQHLNINKKTDGKNTIVNVGYLNKDQRVNEIARMLGGVNITAKTLAAAKEMLSGISRI